MSEKFSEQLYTLAEALKTTNRARGIAIAHIAKKVGALERQLVAKGAEIARLRDIHNERIAQLTAHRVCCGTEHDPLNGKLHGFCVVCGVPWPCEYAGMPIALAETPAAPLTALALPEDDVPDAADLTPTVLGVCNGHSKPHIKSSQCMGWRELSSAAPEVK